MFTRNETKNVYLYLTWNYVTSNRPHNGIEVEVSQNTRKNNRYVENYNENYSLFCLVVSKNNVALYKDNINDILVLD